MSWKKGRDLGIVLGIAGTVVAGVSAFVTAAYLRSGRRTQHSPLLPKVVERQVDRLVDRLDQLFGRDWVDKGMDMLEMVLRGSSADLLVQTLEQVVGGGGKKDWRGTDKLREFVSHLRP